MLWWLGAHLQRCGAPFGWLSSPLVLAAGGAALAAALTWLLLPRLWERMPRDHGKTLAVDGARSQGKPTGTGILFILIFASVGALVAPPSPVFLETLGCVVLAMLSGFMDDASEKPWHEYKKAALDLGIVLLAALALCQWKPASWWLPFTKQVFSVPPVIFVPVAAGLLWLSINATNCTDGVDGLAGSLCAMAFLYLGGLLSLVIGSSSVARHLLIPYDPSGAGWAIIAFTMTGALAAYLWYNANPSLILMGDAGSRPLGLLMGMLVLATGNPFILLAVGGVILVDGATGLVKVALKRFLNVEFLWTIRFPLHDHMKQALQWSNPQVLVRFVLIQSLAAPIVLLILLAMR
jgi:phospho-N-acetylmuramoyl-pentapeptide-transferase